MKILLVDDDSYLREMYATKFKEKGHDVEGLGSGELAVEYLREKTVDVTLMDMVMPGMSGLELLEKIKKEKLGGDPACIVLSNQSEDTDRAEAKRVGATGYIVKAETIPSEVVTKVEALVHK